MFESEKNVTTPQEPMWDKDGLPIKKPEPTPTVDWTASSPFLDPFQPTDQNQQNSAQAFQQPFQQMPGQSQPFEQMPGQAQPFQQQGNGQYQMPRAFQGQQFQQPQQMMPVGFVQPVMMSGPVPGTFPKSLVVSLLLCFFLGEFGAHNFYLGYTGRAIGQLALFIVGLFLSILGIGLVMLFILGLWVLIDFIMIATRSGYMSVDRNGHRLS